MKEIKDMSFEDIKEQMNKEDEEIDRKKQNPSHKGRDKEEPKK